MSGRLCPCAISSNTVMCTYLNKKINCILHIKVTFSFLMFSCYISFQIKSHKIFLAISSPVFYAMFFGDMAEKSPVAIRDIEPEAFNGMLE